MMITKNLYYSLNSKKKSVFFFFFLNVDIIILNVLIMLFYRFWSEMALRGVWQLQKLIVSYLFIILKPIINLAIIFWRSRSINQKDRRYASLFAVIIVLGRRVLYSHVGFNSQGGHIRSSQTLLKLRLRKNWVGGWVKRERS